MFKFLPERQCVFGAVLHTETTERAHPKVVYVLIDDPDFLPVRAVDPVGDHLDGAVGAIQFTNAATGAPVMVVSVVRHNYFTLEPLIHLECFPVFRVLLRHDLPGTEKILPGHRHSDEKGFYAGEDICKIFKETVHSLKMPTH